MNIKEVGFSRKCFNSIQAHRGETDDESLFVSTGTKTFITFISTVIFLGITSLGWSAPEVKVCNQDDVYDRLVCRQGGIVEQIGALDENIRNNTIFSKLEESELKSLKKAKDRVFNGNDRTTKEHFKQLIKKARKSGKPTCYFVEYSGNGDGICEPDLGESCATDSGGICDPKVKNPKKPDVCQEICENESALSDENEDNLEQSIAEELEESYEVVEEQTKKMNETVEGVGDKQSLFATMTTQANSDSCDVIPKPPKVLTDLWISKDVFKVSYVVASSAMDVGLVLCAQSVFGSNGMIACAVGVGVVGVLNVAYTSLDVAFEVAKDAYGDEVNKCIYDKIGGLPSSSDIKGELGLDTDTDIPGLITEHETNVLDGIAEHETYVGGKITTHDRHVMLEIKDTKENLTERIEELRVEMKNQLQEIRTLLKMPAGQRQNFPIK